MWHRTEFAGSLGRNNKLQPAHNNITDQFENVFQLIYSVTMPVTMLFCFACLDIFLRRALKYNNNNSFSVIYQVRVHEVVELAIIVKQMRSSESKIRVHVAVR